MDAKQTYLDGFPESFVKSCDVLLKLDDGSSLPAHSQALAKYSNVIADMLHDGPLSPASILHKKAELPLTDCSRATAISFLTVLYSHKAVKHITQDSSLAIAALAHKLDMKVCLSRCRHCPWQVMPFVVVPIALKRCRAASVLPTTLATLS